MNNNIKHSKNTNVNTLTKRIAQETEICRQTEEILQKLNPSHKALIKELNIQYKASKKVQKYFNADFNNRNGTDICDGDQSEIVDSNEFLCEQIYLIKEANIKLKIKLRGKSQLPEIIEHFENLRRNKQKLIFLKDLINESGDDLRKNFLSLSSLKNPSKRKITLRILGCDRMSRSFSMKSIKAGLPSILKKSLNEANLLDNGDNINAKVRCDLLIRGRVILSTVTREPSLHCWNTTFEYMYDFVDPLEIQVIWLAPYQELSSVIKRDAARYSSLDFVLSALVFLPLDEEIDSGFMNRTINLYPEGRIFLETFVKPPKKIRTDYSTLPRESAVINGTLDSRNYSLPPQPTLSGFTMHALLGTGKFGKIVLCRRLSDRKYYAIKIIRKQEVVESQEYEAIITEKTVLQTIKFNNHPLMVHLISCIQDPGHIMFVLEFVQAGDLATWIHYLDTFSAQQAQFYAASVVLCLEFLHHHNIMYRDLKMENLLLDSLGYIKLVDFGLCKLNMDKNRCTQTFCGTIDYIAPEVLTGNYTRMIDWWTLGVLLYYMLAGEVPFQGSTESESLESIQHKSVTIPRHIDSITSSFIITLLNKNPKSRLGSRNGSTEVKIHPYFTKTDFGRIFDRKFTAPFVPDLKHDLDLSFFDRQFTSQTPKLSFLEIDLNDNPDAKLFFDEFV